MNTDINQIVSKEIIERTLDLGIDYSEIALDNLISNEILAEIPVIKTVTSFYNIRNSIINRHNTKKILTFFQEFNSKKIDDLKFNNFKHKFNTDFDYQTQVCETITLLNERFLHVEKSKILANLIIAHIEDHLSWEELTEITSILDFIQPKAFSLLEELSKINWMSHNIRSDVREGFLLANGLSHRHGTLLKISETGKQLFIFGVNPMKK